MMSVHSSAESTSDLLSAIVAATKRSVLERESQQPIGVIRERAIQREAYGTIFRGALNRPDRFNVIAECKKRSPSAGLIRSKYNVADLALGYANAGAAAISVLTEPGFFDGALSDLGAVRETVDEPLLRKDFIVSEYQLYESVVAGANAILLIAAALSKEELETLMEKALALGLAVLTEIHNERELCAALDAHADVIGVNNRNLRTLHVDLEASARLIKQIPENVITVAESGLATSADLVSLRQAGFDAYLIGESLLKRADPGEALKHLLSDVDVGEPRGRRSRDAK